jgi:integrase
MTKKHTKKVTRNGKVYTYYVKKITLPGGNQKEITAKNKKDWDQKHAQVLKNFAQSIGVESRSMTVADVAEEFLADFIGADAPKTRESRIHHLNKYILPEFGQRKALNVTTQQVRNFYSNVEATKSYKKVAEVHKHFNQMIEWAIDIQRGFIANPIRRDVIKRIRRIAKADRRFTEIDQIEKSFSFSDARRILDAAAGTPSEIVIHLQLLHGLRLGEALAVHWSDIDFDRGEIHIKRQISSTSKSTRIGTRYASDTNLIETHTKTEQSNRHVPLHGRTRVILLLTPKPERVGLVFTSSRGTPMSPSNYRRRIFRPLVDSLGLQLRPHDLRKMFGSFLVASGVDIATVASWMGHTKTSTLLDHYTKVVDERQNGSRELFASESELAV